MSAWHGSDVVRWPGCSSGGTARSSHAVGYGQQPLTRIGCVLVTVPRGAGDTADGGADGESGVGVRHGDAPSGQVVDEEGGDASAGYCLGDNLLPVHVDRLSRRTRLKATDGADVGQRHTDAT